MPPTSANTSVAVITSNLEKNLRDQTDKVATPVVGLSTRLNEMGGDLRTLSQAVGDLTALLNRMQAQLTDINNAIKVIQQPPVAPPAQPGQAAAAVRFRRAPDAGGDHVQRGAPGLRGRQVRSRRSGVRRLSEVLRQHRASLPTRSSTSP